MSKTHLSISILTPAGTLFEHDSVTQVTAKSTTGEITILPNHAPIFTKLEPDEIKVVADSESRYFTIFQGFLSLDPSNHLTIMADTANRSEELNVEAIRLAKEAAEKALAEKEKLSATELLRAETALRRAIMELNVALKKKQRH